MIVDWGGVMTLPPTSEAFGRLQELVGLDADAFPIAWLRHRHAYDLGEVDAAEYWRRVAADGERTVDAPTLAKLRVADAACWAVPNARMVAWLAALERAGQKLALLSNTPREQWEALRETLTWLPLCDAVVLSYELNIAKPDSRIFSRCLADLACGAGEALFIDDRRENVAAAERLGMSAIHFTTAEALRESLLVRFGEALPLP